MTTEIDQSSVYIYLYHNSFNQIHPLVFWKCKHSIGQATDLVKFKHWSETYVIKTSIVQTQGRSLNKTKCVAYSYSVLFRTLVMQLEVGGSIYDMHCLLAFFLGCL